MATQKLTRNGNAALSLGILCQGQGTQKTGIFKELLNSQNPHVRNAAEEVIEGILRRIKPEVFDIYYGDDSDPSKRNSTVNVQPAITAATLVWHKALEGVVGQKIVPGIASGYSLGDFVATNMLGVLSDKDVLRLAVLRGEVFTPLKPGQFYVTTLITKDQAHVHRLNRGLRGTGYRVTIRNAPRVVTVAGQTPTKALEERLEELRGDGTILRIVQLDKDVFYVPFHHCKELGDVADFFESQLGRYCRRESRARGQHVFQDPAGVFVTNDGRKLTSSTDIMHYLARNHIKNLCDFAKTMEVMGRLAGTVIGFGDLSFQKSIAEREGYIQNLVVVKGEADLDAAARAYTTVMEQRTKQGLATAAPTVGLTLQPAPGST